MGSSKPLLPFADSHFLGRLLEEFHRSKARPIVVVLGHEADRICSQVAFGEAKPVVNEDYRHGMLSSIRVGLQGLSEEPVEAALVCPVDHPKVSRRLVDGLILRFEETMSSIVLPVYAGRRGHPVLFCRKLFQELLQAPDSVGARQVVWDHAEDVLEVPWNEPGAVLDVDTPEDYRKLVGQE